MTGAPHSDACPDCVRRSWLVGRLAGHLEVRRAERDAIREVLALADGQLIEALGGAGADALHAEHDRIDPVATAAGWARTGTHAVCRHSPDYPAPLHDLGDAPAVLHVVGAMDRFRELVGADGVAVVGARKASPEGRESARLIARGLSAAGIPVVSGMALGIDSAAHEGAMDAGAQTIAVLACGPEIPYPRSRRELHARLGGRAAVVAELPPGTTPYRWAFPARNRIIAALARMTVVVEAAERSGSLITGEIAIGLGRDVGAVPGSPLSWRCAGTNQLLREGAALVRDAVDVLDGLGAAPHGVEAGAPAGTGVPPGLAPRLRARLEAIDAGADTVDGHADGPDGALAVLADLTELELLGLLRRGPGGRYARVRR